MPKSKSSGFSLVAAMVAVAIVGIVAAALTQMITSSIRQQKFLDFKFVAQTTRLAMIDHLSDRANCTASLAGFNPTTNAPSDPTQIRAPGAAGTIIYQTANAAGNPTYEKSQLRITRMFFRTNPGHTFIPIFAGATRGSAELTVNLASTLPNAGGLNDIFVPIRLAVELGGVNGPITSCVAIGNDADDIWRMNAANEIYYAGGNVGIGISDPAYTLHVVGSVHTTGTLFVEQRIEAGNIMAQSLNAAAPDGTVSAALMRARTFLYTSDERLKKDVQTSEGLSLARQLRGVSFKWKDSGQASMGVIAQEVEKIMPSAVHSDPETGMKSVDYMQLIPVLIQSLKELDRTNAQLEELVKEGKACRR